VESNSVCNHKSDNKIGRPRIGSPICLSRVWLQTELDDKKSYYQLIIKITILEKNAKAWKGKICIKSFYTVSMVIAIKIVIGWFQLQLKILLVDLNYNFECDWLIKLSDNILTSDLAENRSFLN